MIKVMILLLASISVSAQTKYYVSPSGDNSHAGTQASPFKTITKALSVAVDGDSVLLQGGSTFNEGATLNIHGSIGIGAYGIDAKPEITGYVNVTGWSNSGLGANKWKASVPNAASGLKTVKINGSLGIKARQSSFQIYNPVASNDSTVITQGTLAASKVGKELMVRVFNWVTNVVIITAISGTSVSVSPKLTYSPSLEHSTNTYFIQNDTSYLDQTNEFVWDGTYLYVYSTTSPTNVQASVIDTLVNINNQSNISIQNIAFTGANKVAIMLDTGSHHSIKNCLIKDCGNNGIRLRKNNNSLIQYDSIINCFNDAILNEGTIADSANKTNISNNYIKSIGLYLGMGANPNVSYSGINVVGDSLTIYGNVLDSIGYIGCYSEGPGSRITYNEITNFCNNEDDGSGINLYVGTGSYVPSNYTNGMYISYNYVAGGKGIQSYAAGIYLDQNTNGVTIDGNTTYNTRSAGFFCHQCYNNTIRGNLFDDSVGHAFNTLGTSSEIHDLNIKSNILNERNSSNYASYFFYTNSSTNASDSNYYISIPSVNVISWGGTIYTYPAFVTTKGYDVHGGTTLTQYIRPETEILINPTLHDSTIVLTKNYYDVKGNYYATGSSLTLSAFESKFMYVTNLSITAQFYNSDLMQIQ